MIYLLEIRRFIFYFLSAIVTIAMAILCLPALFSKKLNIKVARCWNRIILTILRVVCGIKFKVIGREHLKGGGFIVVSKHQSALETIIYPLIIADPIFIVKKSVFFIPIMGPALKSAGAIYIDRSKGRDSILHMQAQLKDLPPKYSPVIFPEGTRTKPGIRTEKYHSGTALIYEALRYPIVPIAVNTGIFWPKTGPMRPGTATIKILPPISFAKSYDRKQFLAELNEIIETASMDLYKIEQESNA
jgi:1-acyl-sn-glycerol-3-phosphate acyltransferase